MIVTTLDWQPVEVLVNLAMTTVWIPPVPWTIDTSFDQGVGFNSRVKKILPKWDKYYIVGDQSDFNSFDGVSGFTPNKISPFFRVKKDTLLPDNDTILGNNFNSSGFPWNNKINSIKIVGNEIYVFGDFTSYKWEAVNNVAVLDKNTMNLIRGNSWVWLSTTIFIRSMFIVWDKILLNSVASQTYNWSSSYFTHVLNRTDLSYDSTLTAFLNPNGEIIRILEQTDWKIVCVWAFTNIGGISINRIVRFNSDWTLDTTFNTNVGTGSASNINDIIQLSTWELVLTGLFTAFNGGATQRIVILNTDWTNKNLMASGLGSSGLVLTRDNSDNIYVGWQFTTVAGTARTRVAKLSNTLALDATFNPVLTGTALSVTVLEFIDSELFISGTFTWISSTVVNHIAKLSTTTWAVTHSLHGWINNWYVASGLWQIIADGNYIYFMTRSSFLTYADNRFYDWEAINGVAVVDSKGKLINAFSKWFRTSWTYALNATLSGNDLYAYNNFNGYHTLTTRIAKFISDKLDYNYASNTFGTASTISDVIDDNWLLVVWSFTTPANRIVKFDTNNVVDATFNVGSGFWAQAYYITKLQSGKYLVSWTFTTYKWVTQNRIVILNTDWSVDTSFVVDTWPNVLVKHMQLQDWSILLWDGELGALTSWKGVACNRLIKVSLTGDIIPFLSANIDNTIQKVIEHNWKIYVWWSFTSDGVNTVSWLACFDLDWTPVNIFGTKLSGGSVLDLVVDNDWKLVVVWTFTSYDGNPVWRIVRIFI